MRRAPSSRQGRSWIQMETNELAGGPAAARARGRAVLRQREQRGAGSIRTESKWTVYPAESLPSLQHGVWTCCAGGTYCKSGLCPLARVFRLCPRKSEHRQRIAPGESRPSCEDVLEAWDACFSQSVNQWCTSKTPEQDVTSSGDHRARQGIIVTSNKSGTVREGSYIQRTGSKKNHWTAHEILKLPPERWSQGLRHIRGTSNWWDSDPLWKRIYISWDCLGSSPDDFDLLCLLLWTVHSWFFFFCLHGKWSAETFAKTIPKT